MIWLRHLSNGLTRLGTQLLVVLSCHLDALIVMQCEWRPDSETMGTRKYLGLTRKSGSRHVWTGSITLDRGALEVPEHWRQPRMIFVNSMSDLFQDAVPDEFIAAVWAVMQATPRHTFQILTKRPERMAELSRTLPTLPNVWLGVSVEDNDYTFRLDHLRQTSAAIRFVSFEPLWIGRRADLTAVDWAIVGGSSGRRHGR